MAVSKSSIDAWVRQLRAERIGRSHPASPITPDQLRIHELGKRLRRIEPHSKKGYSSLDVRLPEQRSLVEQLKQSHAVTHLCKVFGVQRSSYKYWASRTRTISPQLVILPSEVHRAHELSRGSEGTLTIADIVTRHGIPLSRYHAGKLMKAQRG